MQADELDGNQAGYSEAVFHGLRLCATKPDNIFGITEQLAIALKITWAVLVLVWVIGAFQTKRAARRESWFSRFGIAAVAVVEYLALIWIAKHFGVAQLRFVSYSASYLWIGLLITMAGVAFAIWARVTLGRNWSGMVTVKQDHELIQRGPYALVRHPIYMGIVLAVIGSVIFYGEISGLIFVVTMISVLLHKMKVEERFMSEQFGSAYQDYQAKTKALVPLVW